MKVALDVSAVPAQVAGAGRYVAELAHRLPLAGVETTLVTRRGDEGRWSDNSPSSRIAPLLPTGRANRLAYEVWRLGTSAPARSVDVWHAPHYTMPHRGTTPAVVTIHDLTFFTNPEWHERTKVAFFRRAITYAARHARVLVSVSDFTASEIERCLAVHAPVVVAPHGVDLERFNPDSSLDAELFATHGLAFGVPYIFFLGTVEPRKGLDVLLEAFGDVADGDAQVELWLAGQAGWGVGGLDASIARHRARGRIRRLGFVAEAVLPALLRQSRVVAYPSRGEGFGLPVLEAMACGAEVVTTSDTVMAEVAGGTARLAPVGDAGALGEALSNVLGLTTDVRLHESHRARSRAEQFTWDASIARHLVAYELALGS